MYAQADKNYPPSSVIPKDGFYFDAIIRQNHFDPENLHPEDNTEEFGSISQKSWNTSKAGR